MTRPRPDTQPEKDEAAAVEAFLHANPGFLAARPQLYAVLAPPRRVHGEPLADHMTAMVEAGRETWRNLLEAGRTRRNFGGKVAEAVLALIAAADPFDCVRDEWPARLGVESCRLIAAVPGTAPMARDVTRASPALHGEAAPLVTREALLRVGDHTLVLGAREAADLPNEPEVLAFLAKALAAVLAR
ncbi:hypothetical protein EJV46_18870 [Roseococcus sp. SYP-B2431]|uniref:hypothetical protein n=1 Tax=Roseococcus sp. SYP-B2431 TaxID=2496640 RepID=UPI00103A0455|nr:hypothetical protein [Roseococcus sp. SYP-B2431]TCH96647.1 hypothetical protein EJV46_18870 [Roseococcus sp. SYP-B2431]